MTVQEIEERGIEVYINEVIRQERERCAKIAEEYEFKERLNLCEAVQEIAKAIREEK